MTAFIPPWVFAILALLVYLGYRQSRPRTVRTRTLAITAIAMLAFSLYGVLSAFGALTLPLVCWALGVGGAVLMGGWFFGPRGLSHSEQRGAVNIPGSWMPLMLFLGIFGAKFALGFAAGVHSPIIAQAWFIAAISLALGLLSGAFAVRSLTAVRFARGGHRASPALACGGV